ncbi:MAG: hypothetical protein K0Q65_129 [Clostridia bacterium]|jgi:signal transduction histidine kinase|nr:hypothetical protein [Clostridia bacterium]
MGYLILNHIITIVDAALIMYFASKFLKIKKTGWKNIIISMLLIMLINTTAAEIWGQGNPIATLSMIALGGIVYKIIFREKLLSIYLYFFLGVLLMFVAEATAVLTLLPFGITPDMMHDSFIALLMAGVISKSIYYIMVRFGLTRLKPFKGISKTLAYQIILICFFNFIIIFMALWFYKNLQMPLIKENAHAYVILTTLGALLFSLGILSVTRGLIKQSQKEAEWLVQETEYKRQMFYIKNIEDMLKSIKAQRHDFINHINCIYGLLQLNKPEEAKKYIDRLAKEALVFNNIIDTGNPVLSALLSTKIPVAERNNVQIYTDIRLPEKITIEPIDISIIIGNLLDNALEACVEMDHDDKSIELEVYTRNNNLIIKVKNSKSQLVKTDAVHLEGGFTSKTDKENHGFGLFNIKQAVHKYDGMVKFEDKGCFFLSNIAIPMDY